MNEYIVCGIVLLIMAILVRISLWLNHVDYD
jgi:hypothetical protein